MEQATENAIEFLKGQEIATLTLTQGRFISSIKKLAKRFPDKVIIDHDRDQNGYFLAHIPVDFIKFHAPIELSEEQKGKRREIAERMRAKAFSIKASDSPKTASESKDDYLYHPNKPKAFCDELNEATYESE